LDKNKASGNYAVNVVDDPCDDVVHWLQKVNESLKAEKETKQGQPIETAPRHYNLVRSFHFEIQFKDTKDD
jgi:hypothetical protein